MGMKVVRSVSVFTCCVAVIKFVVIVTSACAESSPDMAVKEGAPSATVDETSEEATPVSGLLLDLGPVAIRPSALPADPASVDSVDIDFATQCRSLEKEWGSKLVERCCLANGYDAKCSSKRSDTEAAATSGATN